MPVLSNRKTKEHLRKCSGMTLIEVVMAMAIVALVCGGVIEAYIQSSQRIVWSGYSMAAQSLAQETIEQALAGVWDPCIPENESTNLNVVSSSYNSTTLTWTGYCTNILDVPYSGTHYVIATNFITIQQININGVSNVWAQVIRVDCVWPFVIRRGQPCFTNTVCTLMAPDNRDPSTF
jgi:prepilin-type N-terminal cleavage/methylation domain-containing protein